MTLYFASQFKSSVHFTPTFFICLFCSLAIVEEKHHKLKPSSLTHVRHLRNSGCVDLLGEYWLIVIYVMDLDDELRFRLHGSSRSSVYSLSSKDVNRFFFPVQSPSGLYVPCVFIDNEEISCSIS